MQIEKQRPKTKTKKATKKPERKSSPGAAASSKSSSTKAPPSKTTRTSELLKTHSAFARLSEEATSTSVPTRGSHSWSLLTDDDLYLFNEGRHYRLYEKLGSHPVTYQGKEGVYFAVWAPDAESVAVIGDFNGWHREANYLSVRGQSGIWEGFVEGVCLGTCYKYFIRSRYNGFTEEKTDPFAMYHEVPPKTASIVWQSSYHWQDQAWMANRFQNNRFESPMSIYEMHLESWMRVPEENGRCLTYRELAPKLVEHLTRLNFTHVEFMPIMEHPFSGSWGYQVTGFFAPTSRFGTPDELMYLVDYLHQNGIGVILDWVPSHFPTDGHGLAYFDGTHLFEHQDDRKGFHPDWKSCIFNYGRNEVRSFLISSALYWLDRYHTDGLRVDAVASMIYLDYSRKEGEWIPNHLGGRENLEAISFLQTLNAEVYSNYPDVEMIAEESTAWPMVSRPTYLGGLGFGLKWDMGWMNDTLRYFAKEPIHRRYHQNDLTFRMLYAFHENFVLPLSHDEVSHGKGSLLGKMPGDIWQKFANLRLLLGYMYAQPGKKLLFMGGEFGQWDEWNHNKSLDWHLLEYPTHAGVMKWVSDLNRVYREQRGLHLTDLQHHGFAWVDCTDWDSSVVSFTRSSERPEDTILVVSNFTPVLRQNYRIGVPHSGFWQEILNSDAVDYWGSGQGNRGGVHTNYIGCHGHHQSLDLTLPPLGIVYFRWCGHSN